MFFLLVIAAIILILALLGVDIGLIVAICLIVIAIMFLPAVAGAIGFMFPGTMIAGIVGAGSYIVAGVALLLAWMVDPETVGKVIEKAGELVEKVAEVAIDTGTGVLGSLLSSPIGWIGLGIGGLLLYNMLSSDDDPAYVDPNRDQDLDNSNSTNSGILIN